MKLLDLNPRWASEGGVRCGFTFDCPHCNERLFVPLNASWKVVGDFDCLTVSPSINARGHWHGFIKSGEVTNASNPR